MTQSTVQPVQATDRVADVLARSEALIDVFVRHSKHFEKLRSRTMRRTMGRLVTVEQAARIGGVAPEALVSDLNLALGLAPAAAAAAATDAPVNTVASAPAGAAGDAWPGVAGREVVELDVRDDLRNGREPFSRIMATVGKLRDDQVLHLRAIFEPAPLFAVLAKRGFAHHAEEHGPDDWSVWFYREEAPASAPAPSGDELPAPAPNEFWLDVRGLEPPEPLVRTLAKLDELSPGQVLVQVNVRVAQFLLPILNERGHRFEIDESRSHVVLLRIWR